MDSRFNTISYCCILKDGQVLYKYTTGSHEIDTTAALCLEMIPPYHKCYFETIAAYTFAFLMDDGFVYFAILRHSLGNSHLLRFLHKLRDEFKKIGTRAEEQFVPVVRCLVASLERVSESRGPLAWPVMNGDAEAGSSTKAPLLARPSKQDKKRMKDDADIVRDIETADHRRSSVGLGASAPPQLQKDFSSSRIKSSTQNQRDKWCRHVKIILAIDAAVCILLLIIWLVICHGVECIR